MALTLSQMLENLYGVKTSYKVNPVVSQVGVSIVKILNNNPNRASFTIFNLSGNAIYISPLGDVSSSKGMYVAPNGGSITLQWDVDFELLTPAWYAIAAGAASDIFLMENILI